MRPFEFAEERYAKYLNERVEAGTNSLGLLCSFSKEEKIGSDLTYDYHQLKSTIGAACVKVGVDGPRVVGVDLSSIDWMQEILRVILSSDVVVVDITHPRPNVIYELGITCSLRSHLAVVASQQDGARLDSSEISQMQMLRYSDYHDLSLKLVQHLKKGAWSIEAELDDFFSVVHRRIGPGAIGLLKTILFSRRDSERQRRNDMWHISWTIDLGCPSKMLLQESWVSQLAENSLVRFEYGLNPEGTDYEWALHPTALGVKYMLSDRFLSFFFKKDEVESVRKSVEALPKSS